MTPIKAESFQTPTILVNNKEEVKSYNIPQIVVIWVRQSVTCEYKSYSNTYIYTNVNFSPFLAKLGNVYELKAISVCIFRHFKQKAKRQKAN